MSGDTLLFSRWYGGGRGGTLDTEEKSVPDSFDRSEMVVAALTGSDGGGMVGVALIGSVGGGDTVVAALTGSVGGGDLVGAVLASCATTHKIAPVMSTQ